MTETSNGLACPQFTTIIDWTLIRTLATASSAIVEVVFIRIDGAPNRGADRVWCRLF